MNIDKAHFVFVSSINKGKRKVNCNLRGQFTQILGDIFFNINNVFFWFFLLKNKFTVSASKQAAQPCDKQLDTT